MAIDATSLDNNLRWYKDAIIYELHIKAFRDSNGDGTGDFSGLLEKLDYLQELGVTAIWVLPFYPSPLKDDGYDIADYYSINPAYGTMDQFRQFLEEAHKRNLKVITELVINHSSDQHPWFQRARRAPKGSPEREFYVWTDDPTQYKDVRIIFQDFETSNWTWDPVAEQYYWHRFFHHQPDLNYDNPQVQEEVFNMLDYWCAMGVDGFRLDAVPYLFEREGTNGENLPETHAFLKKLRAHMDEKYPGTVFLAEANMWPEDAASYFGDGDECHMNYHFPVMPRMFMALQREDRYPITDIFDQTPEIPENCQWAMFLRNHDELTLEMVTDEERDYMYRVYAKDPKARINLGIRHRLAPLMDNDRRKIELMNSLLFSMPGTPVIYYGDEIGMGDNFYLGDRNGVRTPMQWSPDRNAGFSSANPHSLYLPVIIDPEYSYEAVNVELQRRNTSSLFWFMKHLINTRKRYKAFGRGDMKFLNVNNPKILAFTRTYKDETLLIVVNLSKYAQPAEINLPQFRGYTPVEVFSRNKFPAVQENSPYFFTLGGHSFQWYELQPAQTAAKKRAELPAIELAGLSALFDGSLQPGFEELLPAYLEQQTWFAAKKQKVQSLHVVQREKVDLPVSEVYLLLIEVRFESALPQYYSLPVSFLKESEAESLRDVHPQAVIARMKLKNDWGILCDAYYSHEFQHWLYCRLTESSILTLGSSVLHFTGNDLMKQHLQTGLSKPRVHNDRKGNTEISFENEVLLRLYRRVDREPHPDVELSRFLSLEAGFEYVPQYLGTIDWMLEKDSFQLGLAQSLLENHGNGRSYMLERLNNYIERILARKAYIQFTEDRLESITRPVTYDSLSPDMQSLIGGPAAEFCRLLGKRLGELHIALGKGNGSKGMDPEEFSLHYQRSLFASMQSLVRETFERMEGVSGLPDNIQLELERLKAQKNDLLNELRNIYNRKLEATRIRIHGNMQLSQVLYTGRDVVIQDFSGNAERNFSERRLKRSPLRDVTSVIRSLNYVAHEAFLKTAQFPKEDLAQLLPFAGLWAHYMSHFFFSSYLEAVQGQSFIPDNDTDLQVMLRTFLLEGAINDLNKEVEHRSEYVLVPLRVIDTITQQEKAVTIKNLPV